MKTLTWRSLFVGLALVFALQAPALAKDPIIVIEANGTRSGYTKDGIIQFARDYENNPRDLSLEVLGHPFIFDVTCGGGNCTALRFVSPELGIDQTFNGANTAAIQDQLEEYLKTSDFLKRFMRLINSGAGAQLSGGPTSTIGSTVRMGFQDTMFSNIKTVEQKATTPEGRDPQFSGGFAQFSTDGYGGRQISVTPGFTLDFGEHRDKKLKIGIPVSQIDLEGLKTYRAGLGLQYQYPVYLGNNWTWIIAPGLSYAATFSLDLPVGTGLLGGATSTSLNKDWKKVFTTFAAYYGRFNNLGGFDTDLQANIFGWGWQGGYRLGQRWVTTTHVVGLHERVAGFQVNTYHTLSQSLSYKIANKFDLTFSISKLVGLPKQKYLDLGLGSAWFF